MGSPQRGEVTMGEPLHDNPSHNSGPPNEHNSLAHREPTSTAPIEMTEIEEHHPDEAAQFSQHPPASVAANTIQHSTLPSPSRTQQPDTQPPLPAEPSSTPSREPLAITSVNNDPSSLAAAPYPLTREKTAPAIGPSFEKPPPLPQESEVVGPSLLITLLLITGARHPYKIDEKYLDKRNVIVDGKDPVNMSVYTLKELIWREWRDDWEMRPSSPSAIRLIYYGKMLEDKSRLRDCRFESGLIPHVVHMTIKPQEIMDEEDAKMAKTSSRDRDGNEVSAGCRCVIL
ncbi:MAG: hypothetical protein Q9168_005755 [Polycauliona sp. 1 TL-2023]